MASAVNSGAYFCVGADVAISEGHGQWFGRIVQIGVEPGTEAVVAVTDPGTNPFRWEGQQVRCSWRELRAAPARGWQR